jgi:hypothetical protein
MRLKRRILLFLGGWTVTASATCGQTASRLLFDENLLADYFQIYIRDQSYPELPSDYRRGHLQPPYDGAARAHSAHSAQHAHADQCPVV